MYVGIMTADWNILDLLRVLSARRGDPAVIAFQDRRVLVWDGSTLIHDTLRIVHLLRHHKSSRIMLWAPNSPHWIASALAVLATGHVLVPLDDLADAVQFEAALASANPRVLLTTSERSGTTGDMLRRRGISVVVLDAAEAGGAGMDMAAAPSDPDRDLEDLPVPASDAPAMLAWTSGTTGSAKAFLLTHDNLAVNVAAVSDLGIIGRQDRALLPLPLHHAYPFVLGMLAMLTIGAAIVLPGGSTGPAISRALRDGHVTAVIGVPRLYEALLAAIEAEINALGRAARLAWQAGLRAAISLQRLTGLRLGRLLFAPVRRKIAPDARLLVSGGARLEKATEETLEALGWTVLTGYGLAETASMFTGNRPDARRAGSAGRPLAGGEIRIADPDESGIGEIQLRGRSITHGYIDNPEANRAAFTGDGWFRTGDLGFLDDSLFLFVTGRAKEVLVLGGGKKVNPENLERVYGAAPEIVELAVLEDKGGLVALVRPDPAKLRARGVTNLHDGIRVVLGEKAQGLPSYERLSGFALTSQPLPRTRLGKYRRFLLPALYAQAIGGAARRPAHVLGPEDQELLRNPTAAAIWQLLRQRFPEEAIDLDVNLSLDLNIDSFGWMELTLLFQDRLNVPLSEADIASIETIRDLLQHAIERRGQLTEASPAIAADLDRWLAPTGLLLRLLAAGVYGIDRLVMRSLFGVRATNAEQLPASGPFVIAPNHLSYLDPPAIAAALPYRSFRQVYWAADSHLFFFRPFARFLARALHIFPVDANHPSAAIAAANRVLQAGGVQVWFPEGWRSPDGRLQRFLPGIGELLRKSNAPTVPTCIHGAFEALPRTRRLPRLKPISVTFGQPVWPEALRANGCGQSDEERIATALRERVVALAGASAACSRD